MAKKVIESRHPDYTLQLPNWVKYRLLMESGREFIDTYLQTFSDRESTNDFATRRDLSYNPAFAKAAVMEVSNAIYQRLVDITRVGGPKSYQEACLGLKGGVDKNYSTMTYFMGTRVLPELLPMGTVGVFVDRQPLPQVSPLGQKPFPYLYIYRAEDILTWSKDEFGDFQAVLLCDNIEAVDPNTELVTGYTRQYRLMRRTSDGVVVTLFDKEGVEISTFVLALPKIPFVSGNLGSSLLCDIADHQIALLNIASSDLAFILYANFPFYTEQSDPYDSFQVPPGPTSEDGSTVPSDSTNNKIEVGVTKGRRYPKGTDRPQFIAPPSEPLKVSMEKQQEIKEEIRTLINLTIANLRPVRASADSKVQDDRTLEAGLSYIGLELNHIESKIAEIWALYENASNPEIATVKYPGSYALKSDTQRLDEATKLNGFALSHPSPAYRKAVCKEVARITMANKLGADTLEQIDEEIDNAVLVNIDPEQIRQDHEAGLVGTETASKLRGYADGEVDQAKIDHADRLARIAISQTKGDAANLANASDRGVTDLETE